MNSAQSIYEVLVQRALLTTSDVLARLIDEGDGLSPDGVHAVRVSIKRLRATWRLLATTQADAAASAAIGAEARLRALHHALAVDRLRAVRAATLERLAGGAASPALDEAIAVFGVQRAGLLAQAAASSDADIAAAHALAESAGRTFRAESKAWRELPPVTDAVLHKTLRNSYRQVRRAADALDGDRLARYHRLRLRLKRLLYQLEACGLESCIDGDQRTQWWWFAERLGRLQDLEDLGEAVHANRMPKQHSEVLHARIAHAKRRLRRKLDARVVDAFAARPRAFIRALEATGDK